MVSRPRRGYVSSPFSLPAPTTPVSYLGRHGPARFRSQGPPFFPGLAPSHSPAPVTALVPATALPASATRLPPSLSHDQTRLRCRPKAGAGVTSRSSPSRSLIQIEKWWESLGGCKQPPAARFPFSKERCVCQPHPDREAQLPHQPLSKARQPNSHTIPSAHKQCIDRAHTHFPVRNRTLSHSLL